MKKIFMLILIVSILAIQCVAYAADGDNLEVARDNYTADESKIRTLSGETEASAVVGEDIVIGEGEVKILSAEEESSPVVGEDITVGEGQVKIVSVDENSTPVSNDGSTADESKKRELTSKDTSPVVGEDIKLEEGQVKIVSIGAESSDAQKSSNYTPYYIGVAVAALTIAGLAYRKLAHR